MTLAVDAQTTLAKLIAKFSVDSDVVFKLRYALLATHKMNLQLTN